MMEVSFGKNIKYKNDQRIHYPFFISFSKFHNLYALPGAYNQQKTYQAIVKILLLNKTRKNAVDKLSSQRSRTKNDNGYINET